MISHKWSPMKRLIWLRGSGITGGSATWETITGNPVSFSAKAAPLRQLSVAFSPKQEGSGDPSPDNVRPISGWDSLTVEQRGKNLFDLTSETLVDNYFVKHSDGGRTSNNLYCMTDYLDVSSLNGKTLITTPGLPSFASSPGFAFYDADKTFLSGANYNVQVNGFVVPNGAKYMRLSFYKEYITNGQVMVEFGTERTSYTPYNPLSRSISITLGSTVYSGTLDVVTGVGEVTHGVIVYDGTENYINTYFPTVVCNKTFANGADGTLYCNCMKSGDYGFSNAAKDRFQFNKVSTVWGVSSADELKTQIADMYADGNPVTIVYPLATPIPITLTPQEVQSLLGENVLFSDANGDLTVEYRSN